VHYTLEGTREEQRIVKRNRREREERSKNKGEADGLNLVRRGFGFISSAWFGGGVLACPFRR
jgi:hypothetical protein